VQLACAGAASAVCVHVCVRVCICLPQGRREGYDGSMMTCKVVIPFQLDNSNPWEIRYASRKPGLCVKDRSRHLELSW